MLGDNASIHSLSGRYYFYGCIPTKGLIISFSDMPGQHISCLVLQDQTCAARFVGGTDVKYQEPGRPPQKIKNKKDMNVN